LTETKGGSCLTRWAEGFKEDIIVSGHLVKHNSTAKDKDEIFIQLLGGPASSNKLERGVGFEEAFLDPAGKFCGVQSSNYC